MEKFTGKNYSIETNREFQFVLIHPVGENELFDSFDKLVEAHPLCEECRLFFFGAAIGITSGWTLFNSQGYIEKNGCEVEHYIDGTTRVNGTLHATDDFLSITENRVDFGSWYLEK